MSPSTSSLCVSDAFRGGGGGWERWRWGRNEKILDKSLLWWSVINAGHWGQKRKVWETQFKEMSGKIFTMPLFETTQYCICKWFVEGKRASENRPVLKTCEDSLITSCCWSEIWWYYGGDAYRSRWKRPCLYCCMEQMSTMSPDIDRLTEIKLNFMCSHSKQICVWGNQVKAQLPCYKMMQSPQWEELLFIEFHQKRTDIRLISNTGAGKDQESVCSD